MAREHVANVQFARLGCLAQKFSAGIEDPTGAEATLQRMVTLERGLQIAELAALAQALDRVDMTVLRLDGQHQTGAVHAESTQLHWCPRTLRSWSLATP